ncbi:alpha/beta hydrolase [Caulobacter segnis]|uniref:RBBP9/YdeN family alpha/beta hydrolase n=1 Tax=Caulobacter segnis TaxID=88688 RepID=UPI00240F43AB|nr:alpha/beta hydrolase [Caulobacter segnis]MDG2522535.1 alpha/beta hydrolase [Caulobacter segnis]
MRPSILILPGLHGSEEDHWQSQWERLLPQAERVVQADWSDPLRTDWLLRLDRALERRPGAFLVAHSLGCALVAHHAELTGGQSVAGALLVAPADVERPGAREPLTRFAPLPRKALPFPSVLVASRDDPWMAFSRARALAEHWGSRFVDVGPLGHINVAAGVGPWIDGLRHLTDLMEASARQERFRPRDDETTTRDLNKESY